MMKINNPYDKRFELYLIKKGYDLNTISLTESLRQLKIYNKNEVRN